jgi:hypothetical protein
MKNTLLLAAVMTAAGIGLGAGANASAASTRASKNDCVFTRSVHDFRPLDRSHMVLWGPGRKAYLVQLSFPLPELKFANRLAFVDRDNNGMLCGYGMDRIVIADSGFGIRTPSTILGMTRLDDAGVAQLEEKYDVRLTRKKKAGAQGGPGQPEGTQPVGNPEKD